MSSLCLRHFIHFSTRLERALLYSASSASRYPRISSRFSSLRSSAKGGIGGLSASSEVCSAVCWSTVLTYSFFQSHAQLLCPTIAETCPDFPTKVVGYFVSDHAR